MGAAYGAQECDEVKVRIKGKAPQDALKRISIQLKLHGRAFTQFGAEYENQLDIACLIGLYMTTGLDTNVLERYIALEALIHDVFGPEDQNTMQAIWAYQDKPFIAESMRREYYAHANFFLAALANMSEEIGTVERIDGFPYRMIQDHAFCSGAIRDREKLDLHRRAVQEINVTEKDWSVLSEREFKQNKKTWIEKPELIEVCGQDKIVTSRTVQAVRDTYIKKANDLTQTYWKGFLEDGRTPERGWRSLDWLEPSCSREPSKNEKRIINNAKEMAKDLDSSKWWQPNQYERYRESSKIANQLQTVGEPSCRDSIGKRLTGFGNAIDSAQEEFRNAIKSDHRKYWDGLAKDSEDQNLKERLTNYRSFIAEITRQPEKCVVPNEEFEALIQSDRDLRESETLTERARALKKITSRDQKRLNAFSEECDGKPAVLAKLIVERIEHYRAELKIEYRTEILNAWIKFYKTGKYDQAWSGLSEMVNCDECAPMPEDEEVIVSLKVGRDIDREVIQRFYNRLGYWSEVSAPGSFLEIRNDADRYIKDWDKEVVRYWNDFLKTCQIPAPDQNRIHTSTNEICSLPSESAKEDRDLLRYCRLNRLSRHIRGMDDVIPVAGDPCFETNIYGNPAEGVWKFREQSIADTQKIEPSGNDDTKPSDRGATQNSVIVPYCHISQTGQSGGSGKRSDNSESSNLTDRDLGLLEIFRPDILSNEAKDEGFTSPGNYKNSFSALKPERLEDIFESRVQQCTSTPKGISFTDIELLRSNYLSMFSQLVTDLNQRGGDSNIELSHLLEDIVEQYLKGHVSSESRNEKEKKSSKDPDQELYSLHIRSYPLDAAIFIDGKEMGMTPKKIEIASGDHTLRLEKDGYEIHEEQITIPEDDYLSPTLKEESGTTLKPKEGSENDTCTVGTFGTPKSNLDNMPILKEIGINAYESDYVKFCDKETCSNRITKRTEGGLVEEFEVVSIDIKKQRVILINVSQAEVALDLPVRWESVSCKVINK